MKADTILMLAGLGAVAVGGYMLIKPATDALNNLNKGIGDLSNIPNAISQGFTGWTNSFIDTPAQVAAREATAPAAVVAEQRDQAQLINPQRFTAFVSGTQGQETTPNFPDVAQAIVSQQQGYIAYKPDNQISLGSSGSRSVVYTAPPVQSTIMPSWITAINGNLVQHATTTLMTGNSVPAAQQAAATLLSSSSGSYVYPTAAQTAASILLGSHH